MSSVEIFKAHHATIRTLIGEVSDHLTEDGVAAHTAMLSEKLELLFRTILVHLNAEDTLLYPDMLGSGNDKARRLAHEYQEEMGWIAGSFKRFVGHWAREENMTSEPAKFCRETHKILHSLKDRIDKEERFLYPQSQKCLPVS
jgi:DUF438 domain-containing protein